MRRLLAILIVLLSALSTLSACSGGGGSNQQQIDTAVTGTLAAQPPLPPILIAPAAAATIENAWNLTLDWAWVRDLDASEYYDVRVWRPGEPAYGITWTREPTFNLSNWMQAQSPGEYRWSVAVIEGVGGEMQREVTAMAQPRTFTVADTSPPPAPVEAQPIEALVEAPPGFTVALYHRGLSEPSVITFGPGDLLYVLTRNGEIFTVTEDGLLTMLFDNTDDLLSESVGLAFHDDVMYISDKGRISTFTDADDDGTLDTLTPIVEGLPAWLYWAHSNNGIVFGPDDRLYVGIGATTDHGPLNPDYPLEASVLRMNPDGSDLETFATGFRNPYDLAFSPDGDLFSVDNNPDVLDDTLRFLPPEELNHIRANGDYGFPAVFADINLQPGVTPPVAQFNPSVASSGLTYYSASSFPADWRDGLFVAHWGSGLEKNIRNGRMVVFVALSPTEDGTFTGDWRPFLRFDRGQEASRPVDVTVGPDGALYVAEYVSGAILRVEHTGERVTVEAPPETLDLDADLVTMGDAIYHNGTDRAPSCAACHLATGGGVGPTLHGQLEAYTIRVPGQSAREYVRSSITQPNDYVTEGYTAGVMYQDYAANLTADEIDALVEYVLSIAD